MRGLSIAYLTIATGVLFLAVGIGLLLHARSRVTMPENAQWWDDHIAELQASGYLGREPTPLFRAGPGFLRVPSFTAPAAHYMCSSDGRCYPFTRPASLSSGPIDFDPQQIQPLKSPTP